MTGLTVALVLALLFENPWDTHLTPHGYSTRWLRFWQSIRLWSVLTMPYTALWTSGYASWVARKNA